MNRLGFRAIGAAAFAFAVMLLTPEDATGQLTMVAAPVKAAMLVQNPRQVETVLRTSIEMRDGVGLAADSVTIIFCGDAITRLVAETAPRALIASAHNRGVRLVACGITMNQKNITSEQLVNEATVVDNGLIELLSLQLAGFVSIEL